eukprot:CAMPEP_0198735766 /NCGR_PEP_ID=MMETSP1475-20131203/61629_1 /TAXON_ID= ORGANISM="Unidentified sp., Strain CCMP1999" /NCGR_SAMPLE_ID=MMETSP1475 /ASSEMBLY_ACC=CAM_ASM_001111 /LENGTH=523 /DNA_ID=CAMNT_0044499483 /DNA_START=46 /DNA_END=1614 /DNA_ORIENTATION=-
MNPGAGANGPPGAAPRPFQTANAPVAPAARQEGRAFADQKAPQKGAQVAASSATANPNQPSAGGTVAPDGAPPKRRRGRPPGAKTGTGAAARKAAAAAAAAAAATAASNASALAGEIPAPGAMINMVSARRAEEALIKSGGLYYQVTAAHDDLDERIWRKLEEAKDACADVGEISERTFRVLITSTGHGTSEPDGVPCWSLRIQGCLLDNPEDLFAPTAAIQKATMRSAHQARFSHFFRRVIVVLDENAYPGQNIIEWSKLGDPLVCDAVEITRPGKQPTVAKILMEVDNVPERFEVTDALRAILGEDTATETKASATEKVWKYIEDNDLCSGTSVDDLSVRLDSKLRALLEVEEDGRTIAIMELINEVKCHLVPIKPIVVSHQITTTKDRADGMTALNVKVYVTENYRPPNTVLASQGFSDVNSSETTQYRNKSYEYLEQASVHNRRVELLENYAKNPKATVDSIVMAKTKDEKSGRLLGKGFENPDEKRKDPLKAPWVAEVSSRMALKSAIENANKEVEEL